MDALIVIDAEIHGPGVEMNGARGNRVGEERRCRIEAAQPHSQQTIALLNRASRRQGRTGDTGYIPAKRGDVSPKAACRCSVPPPAFPASSARLLYLVKDAETDGVQIEQKRWTLGCIQARKNRVGSGFQAFRVARALRKL